MNKKYPSEEEFVLAKKELYVLGTHCGYFGIGLNGYFGFNLIIPDTDSLKEDLLEEQFSLFSEMIYNPLVKNNCFSCLQCRTEADLPFVPEIGTPSPLLPPGGAEKNRSYSSRELMTGAPSARYRSMPWQHRWSLMPAAIRYTSRPCSKANSAVMRAPDFSGAAATTVTGDRAAIILFRWGKRNFSAGTPGRYSDNRQPPRSSMVAASFLWLRGTTPSAPQGSTATVFPSPAKAPLWTAASIPKARPDTMV